MPQKSSYEALESRIEGLERQVETLQSEAERYRTLFNVFPHGISISDAQGNVIETNAAAEKLLDVSKAEHEKRSIESPEWRIIRPDGSDMPAEEWASVISLKENKLVSNCEMGIAKSKNDVTWISVTAAPLPGEGQGVVITYSDISEKKELEKQLREKKNVFRQLFQNTGFYGYIVSTEGIILEANQAALEMLGYDRDEIIGQPLHILYAEESMDKAKKIFQQWKKKGHVNNAELLVKTKNGEKRWVLLNVDSIRDASGKIVHSASVQIDITERKKAEKQIYKSEEQYSTIFKSAPLMIAISTLKEGKYIDVNETFTDLSGYTREELIGNTSIELGIITPEHREKLIRYLMENKTIHNHEMTMKTKLGATLVAEFAAQVTELDGQEYLISTSKDITRQKKVERIMEIQHDLSVALSKFTDLDEALRAMVDAITGFEGLDSAGIYLLNQQTGGLDLAYVQGFGPAFTKLIQHYDKNTVHTQLVMKGSPIYRNYESLGLPTNGVRKQEGIKIAGIIPLIHRGTVLGCMNVTSHTTGKIPKLVQNALETMASQIGGVISRLQMEMEKNKLQSRLLHTQKMESIGNLAGGIAHDFNNILYPIVGMAELLLEDLPKVSPEYQNAREILKAGQRGSSLVKQILAFSRQGEQRMLPVRIQQILKEALQLIRSTIPANISIKQDIQQDCGLVMADPTQVHQIAMNLITNAFHAVEDNHGTITVRFNETLLKEDDCTGRNIEPGRYAQLTIADTGCGIDPSIIGKIFEPYFTTKKQDKGTGIGLAVLYGIVKKHKGHITVSSKVGKGTTFHVFLPLLDETAESLAVEEKVDELTGNERILLVDDEEGILLLERQILERLGYQVTARSSSMDALMAFRADPNRFDLVVADMAMPGMTGEELARELQSVRPDVPMIICTGFSERIDREKAERTGIKGFLMKPVLKSDMAKTVRKVLDDAL